MTSPPSHTLRELAALFTRLGVTAFGGPAVHVAMMEEEVVRRRRWLTRDELLDLIGAANLIPGPNSTELAIHIGLHRGGVPGLLVSGVCFIVPAAVITLAFAAAYVRLGSLPEMQGVLYGIKPVIVAVVVQALVGLARSALKTRALVVIGALALALTWLRVSELVVLVGAGLAAMAAGGGRDEPRGDGTAKPAESPAAAPLTLGALAPLTMGSPTATKLFLVFAKIGSVLYGSGYVLLAFLRSHFVEQRGWLTEGQLLDAVAVGQVTPGPVFTTATFVGYVVAGLPGACAATLGIFLPAFAFVAASGFLVPRLRASVRAGRFLDGVNVASLALMVAVTVDLGRAAIVDGGAVLLAVVSAALVFRTRVSSAWLVLGGALVGAFRVMFLGR